MVINLGIKNLLIRRIQKNLYTVNVMRVAVFSLDLPYH